jgi:hypothetical protein
LDAFFAPQKTGLSGGSAAYAAAPRPSNPLRRICDPIPCAKAPLRGEHVHNVRRLRQMVMQINADYTCHGGGNRCNLWARENPFNFYVPEYYQVLKEFLTAKSKKSNKFQYKASFFLPYFDFFDFVMNFFFKACCFKWNFDAEKSK